MYPPPQKRSLFFSNSFSLSLAVRKEGPRSGRSRDRAEGEKIGTIGTADAMAPAATKTPSMSGTEEDSEADPAQFNATTIMTSAIQISSDDDGAGGGDGQNDEEFETQSISTPTRLHQRRVSGGGGGGRGGQKRRASMETNELSGVPKTLSTTTTKKKKKKKKSTKRNGDDATKRNEEEEENNPHVVHAKRLRRAKRACFELAAASATLKELVAKYATKSKDVVVGGEVVAKWFERHNEAQSKWKQLMKELMDIESDLKKRANEVDVYGGNTHALRAEEAALLRYVQFALWRAKPMASIGELRDDEVCRCLEKVVETHGVRFVLSLSTVSKQFRRCIRSPLVWKSNFNLSTETGISDRNLLEILKEDDAMSLCSNIRLDGCRFLTERSIMRLLERAGKSVETLSMVNVAGVTNKVMELISKKCTNIHTLDVRNCENLSADYVLGCCWPGSSMHKVRKLKLKGCEYLRGSVPVASFYALFNTLKENHEIEDDKIEKIAGFRLHDMKEKNGGVVYRDDDETVTEEQRKIARDIEAKHACSVDVEGLILTTWDKIQKWHSNDLSGIIIAACEHAAAVQHGNPLAANALTLMPRCGHVMCDQCELNARKRMVTHSRDDGSNLYTYPCPACNQPMPPPGGFSIELMRRD